MKHCPQCNQDLPESAFGHDKNSSSGLTCWCKACKNRKGRERYATNPEVRKARADNQRRLLSDPVKHEEQKDRQRAWYAEHYADPEYRASENERYRRDYHSRTPEQRRRKAETNQAYREANREHVNRQHREYVKERYHNDPEFKADLRSYFVRYQNTKRANGGSFTSEEWQTMCLLVGGRCVACGQIKDLTVDHVIPVTKGGRNDMANIQPLCQSCNSSKGTMTIDYRSLMLIGSMTLEAGV